MTVQTIRSEEEIRAMLAQAESDLSKARRMGWHASQIAAEEQARVLRWVLGGELEKIRPVHTGAMLR